MNPNTYGWYQCDPEEYDTSVPPEEQASWQAEWERLNAEREDAEAYGSVPPYVERDARARHAREIEASLVERERPARQPRRTGSE